MFVYPVTRSLPSVAAAPRLSRLLDTSFERFFAAAVTPPSVRTPALDVGETDTHYIVAFDLPGVAREQLKVLIEGRRVSVESSPLSVPTVEAAAPVESAESKPEAAAAPRTLYRERGESRYARTLSLPTEVDQTTSQARFENGVLTLTLTKRVPAGATQLAVA